MYTVKLKIDEEIYDNIMFILKNLKIKGIEVYEENSNNARKLKNNLKTILNNDINLFQDIKDPVLWQKEIRKEWD